MNIKKSSPLIYTLLGLLLATKASAGAPQLGIEVAVTGDGSVTSVPSGITCPDDCDEVYKKGTKVVLTATASTGASFLGWSGACAGTQLTCQISMVETTFVSASFSPVIAIYPAPVLATGQKTCWTGIYGTSQGTQVNCEGTGQDGEFQAGVPFPAPRFVDNSDGTITDQATGLMWMQDLNCIGNRYPDLSPYGQQGRVLWQAGLDFVAGLNSGTYDCGAPAYTDWRMPNINELLSLLDFEKVNPQPREPFISWTVGATTTMSSTTDIREPGYAWGMGDGGRGADLRYILKNPDPVGQPGNESRLWIVRGP